MNIFVVIIIILDQYSCCYSNCSSSNTFGHNYQFQIIVREQANLFQIPCILQVEFTSQGFIKALQRSLMQLKSVHSLIIGSSPFL